MNVVSDPAPLDDDDPLRGPKAALEELRRLRAAGQSVDIDEFCAARPEIAIAIRCLYSLEGEPDIRPRSSNVSLRSVLAKNLGLDAPSGRGEAAGGPLSGSTTAKRFVEMDEVSRDASSRLLYVLDEELRRPLATRVLDDAVAHSEGDHDASVDGRAGTMASEHRSAERFLAEARVTARLAHPGVPPVHQLGVDENGRVFYAMRWVKGRTLRELLAGDESSAKSLLGVLVKVCRTLAFAHQRGVVHGDLSAAKVLHGRWNEVHVIDWGRAPDESQPGDDVLSLGVILDEILARRAPAGSSRATSRQRKVPAELVAIRDKAAHREAQRRYATAGELSEDLQAYLDGRVVAAHRVGAAAELRKWITRNRTFAIACAVAIVCLFAGLGAAVLVERVGRAALKRERNDLAAAEARSQQNRAVAQAAQERVRVIVAERLALSDSRLLDELRSRADELWPVEPGLGPELDRWLEQAEALIARLPDHRREMSLLRVRGRRVEEPASGGAGWQRSAELSLIEGDRVRGVWRLAPPPGRMRFRRSFHVGADLDLSRAMLTWNGADGIIHLNGDELLDARGGQTISVPAALFLPGRENLLCVDTPAREGLDGAVFWLTLHDGRGLDLVPFQTQWRYRYVAASDLADPAAAADPAADPAADRDPDAELAWTRADFDDSSWALERPVYLDLVDERRRALAIHASRTEWFFDDAALRREHERLAALVGGIGELAMEDSRSGITAPTLAALRRRRREVERIATLESDGATQAAWTRAIDSIANPQECPRYGGLRIEPQTGLVPIGRDARSGLWEFAHTASGEPARRGAAGDIAIVEDTGIVLVLVPGGTFRMGAVPPSDETPESAANVYRGATPNEAPLREVTLEPYFLSKLEITAAQWKRLTGRSRGSTEHLGPLEPEGLIDWPTAYEVLARIGLDLPTEAQWEYAACANPSTLEPRPWPSWREESERPLATVGRYAANPLGFHDLHSNFQEWCADGSVSYEIDPETGTGLRPREKGLDCAVRGISQVSSRSRIAEYHPARRAGLPARTEHYHVGVRPARRLERRDAPAPRPLCADDFIALHRRARSIAGIAAVTLRLENGTDWPLDVYWIDPRGAEIRYGRVEPHAQWEGRTASGHVWRLRAPGGAPVAIHTANDEPLQVRRVGR